MQGDDVNKFRKCIRSLQKAAKIPLYISADFEQGCGQIISDGSCTEFPSLMAFGAIKDNDGRKLAYKAGKVVAEEASYIGVNITPSPVFDVNTAAENPNCNTRSVSDNPEKVISIAINYALGMSSLGKLLPQAKHFPGEGMHKKDPHFALEVMDVSLDEMEQIHLAPFIEAKKAGIPMMMTNHAIYPPFDSKYPATLSKKIITSLLRDTIGFEGLVITDSMRMHGITERFTNKKALILAINAGNDLILGPPAELGKCINWVVDAVKSGEIKEETIDGAVRKILYYKKKFGLFVHKLDMPEPKMSIRQRQKLAIEIAEKSITLVKNRKHILPLNISKEQKILILEPKHPRHPFEWGLHFNIYGLSEFVREYHTICESVLFGAMPDNKEIIAIIKKARQADVILISTFFRSRAGQVGLLTASQVAMMKKITNLNKKIIYIVSNPYVIAELPFADTIIVTYGCNKTSIRAAVDVIFGKVKALGKLPVKVPSFIDASKVEIVCHD